MAMQYMWAARLAQPPAAAAVGIYDQLYMAKVISGNYSKSYVCTCWTKVILEYYSAHNTHFEVEISLKDNISETEESQQYNHSHTHTVEATSTSSSHWSKVLSFPMVFFCHLK